MILLKVFYDDGDYTITKFNGDMQQAEEYYLNKQFLFNSGEFKTCAKIKNIGVYTKC
jgi:hypothetical protein